MRCGSAAVSRHCHGRRAGGFRRSAEAVERPVIAELVDFVEVFVVRFEDAEGDAVHLLCETHVGAVDEAVGVFRIELRGEARDWGGLGIAGGDVGVEIGIAVEKLRRDA